MAGSSWAIGAKNADSYQKTRPVLQNSDPSDPESGNRCGRAVRRITNSGRRYPGSRKTGKAGHPGPSKPVNSPGRTGFHASEQERETLGLEPCPARPDRFWRKNCARCGLSKVGPRRIWPRPPDYTGLTSAPSSAAEAISASIM